MDEPWAVVVATLRRIGAVPMALRAAVLLSAVVAIVATTTPAWDVPNGYMYIAGIAAAIAVIVPYSGGWFFVGAALVVGWALGSPSATIGPAVVVTALALLAGHVACALAAAMPATAAADVRLLVRWWRPTIVLTGATVATAVLVALLEAWTPPGSVVVVIAALAVVAAAVWWWSSGTDDAAP